DDPQDVDQAVLAAQDHVTQPVDLAVLFAMLRRVLVGGSVHCTDGAAQPRQLRAALAVVVYQAGHVRLLLLVNALRMARRSSSVVPPQTPAAAPGASAQAQHRARARAARP